MNRSLPIALRHIENPYDGFGENYKTIIITMTMAEFDVYKSIDENSIILHIDEPLDKTFVEMVYADILFMAPSALSYTAGILSDNTIYYIPYNCQPLSHWNIVEGYSSSKVYNFLLKSVDLCIDYDSIDDKIIIKNLDEIRQQMS